MSLIRSLQILEQQQEGRTLRSIVSDLSWQIDSGNSFSEALTAHPRVFPAIYVNLVRAGELGGELEATLSRLADFLERSQKLKAKLKWAMLYPGAVVIVAGGVLALLIAFIVPSFERLFEGMLEGAPLPAFTRLIFGVSRASA